MQILHLTNKDYKTGLWSGGSTTELFIWPRGADYSMRAFNLRISSARVDLEESDFTPLPGVVRYITPLSGGFTLTHPDGKPVAMQPLSAPYRFLGEIPTHCIGKATDFNLMLKGIEGEMSICNYTWQLREGFNCLYAITDTTVNLTEKHSLKSGELLVVFIDKDEFFEATVNKSAIVCFAKI